MSGSTEIALAHQHRRLRGLERTVRRLVRGILALAVACAILVGLTVLNVVDRNEARHYYNDQIKKLVCGVVALAPPHKSAITDRLRAGYHCPPYKAPSKRHRPHRNS